jgi:hypothetical protein
MQSLQSKYQSLLQPDIVEDIQGSDILRMSQHTRDLGIQMLLSGVHRTFFSGQVKRLSHQTAFYNTLTWSAMSHGGTKYYC